MGDKLWLTFKNSQCLNCNQNSLWLAPLHTQVDKKRSVHDRYMNIAFVVVHLTRIFIQPLRSVKKMTANVPKRKNTKLKYTHTVPKRTNTSGWNNYRDHCLNLIGNTCFCITEQS